MMDPTPLSPAAEAVLRADVADLEKRGRDFAGRFDILSLLATLDHERSMADTEVAALREALDAAYGPKPPNPYLDTDEARTKRMGDLARNGPLLVDIPADKSLSASASEPRAGLLNDAEKVELVRDAVQAAASVGMHFPALCHAFGLPDTTLEAIDRNRREWFERATANLRDPDASQPESPVGASPKPDYLRAPVRLEQHDPYDSGFPYLDRQDVYSLIDRELGTLAVTMAGPLGTDARVERVRTSLLDALGPGPQPESPVDAEPTYDEMMLREDAPGGTR